MKKNIFSIAIDGPAGAGKSTIAKKVSELLGIEYIDTGAMYRALTLKVLRNNINPRNTEAIIELLTETNIVFNDNHIYLDGFIVDKEIRENRISSNASYIAVIKEVREKMVELQQKMANTKSVIMDGRDITTVVLPNADFKFFVTATVEERGKRRYKELIEKGEKNITLDQIIEDIKRRDNIKDSYLLDTTDKSLDECVNIIISMVKGGI